MSILPAQEIIARLTPLPEADVEVICGENRWDDLGGRIGIFPFARGAVSPISYDLGVGKEAYSLRYSRKVVVSEEQPLRIEPGETVLVLINEYIALPPSIVGIVLGRISRMNSGLVQSMTKVDPTWYGRFPVPLTNLSRRVMTLAPGESLCTMILWELDNPLHKDHWLKKDRVRHLGGRVLRYEPEAADAWEPRDPKSVVLQHIEELPKMFGPPFDTILGGFIWARADIIKHMEDSWGQNALRSMKDALWAEEIKILREGRDQQIALMKDQLEVARTEARATQRMMIGVYVTLVLAVVGWIASIAVFVWKILPLVATKP